ncbi:MAG: dTMP kinase [Aestuariivirgaceae bacterium]
MARGLFITFEGGEGTGKTTQLAKLAAALRKEGIDVLCTREPGGSPEAETIRNELVSGDAGRWSPLAEALLMNAARDSHLRNTIRPALERGTTVICDRFVDSTRAYQGAAGGVDMKLIHALEKSVVGPTMPDLTLIFDLDPKVGLARAKASEDRFERKGAEFHLRLADAYREIARAEPVRCHLIDASAPPDAVSAAIMKIILPLIRSAQ